MAQNACPASSSAVATSLDEATSKREQELRKKVEDCCACKFPAKPRHPMFLPCLHTICSPCLAKLYSCNQQNTPGPATANWTTCPLCKYPFQQNQVMTNFLLDQSHATCDSDCKSSLKVFQCAQCNNKTFCARCGDKHKRDGLTKDHTLTKCLSTNDPAVRLQLMSINMCTDCAKNEIKVFCEPCHQYVCCECQLTGVTHRDHAKQFTLLDDKVKMAKDQISQGCTNLEKEIRKILVSHKEKGVQRREKLETMKISTVQDMRKQLEIVRNAVEARCVELENKLNQVFEEHIRKVFQGADVADNLINMIEQNCAVGMTALESNDGNSVLMLGQLLRQQDATVRRIKEEKEPGFIQNLHGAPGQFVKIDVKMTKELEMAIENFGSVFSVTPSGTPRVLQQQEHNAQPQNTQQQMSSVGRQPNSGPPSGSTGAVHVSGQAPQQQQQQQATAVRITAPPVVSSTYDGINADIFGPGRTLQTAAPNQGQAPTVQRHPLIMTTYPRNLEPAAYPSTRGPRQQIFYQQQQQHMGYVQGNAPAKLTILQSPHIVVARQATQGIPIIQNRPEHAPSSSLTAENAASASPGNRNRLIASRMPDSPDSVEIIGEKPAAVGIFETVKKSTGAEVVENATDASRVDDKSSAACRGANQQKVEPKSEEKPKIEQNRSDSNGATNEESSDDDDMDAPCAVCMTGCVDADDKFLIECDTCHENYHLDCHLPPYTKAPAGDWHCHRCCDKVYEKVEEKWTKAKMGPADLRKCQKLLLKVFCLPEAYRLKERLDETRDRFKNGEFLSAKDLVQFLAAKLQSGRGTWSPKMKKDLESVRTHLEEFVKEMFAVGNVGEFANSQNINSSAKRGSNDPVPAMAPKKPRTE